MLSTPQNVADAIDKLGAADQEIIKTYIAELHGIEIESPSAEPEAEPVQEDQSPSSADDDLPRYDPSNGQDFDKATTYKILAAEFKASGDYPTALLNYNSAITSAPPSALLLANRADILFRLNRYQDAVTDCDEALTNNPDSAKALRIRGRALKELGEYERSRKDLAASQQIDYDDGAAEDLKFVADKMKEIEADQVKIKLEEEERKKKRLEEIRKAQEEAKKEQEAEEVEARASASAGPGAGFGGMPGGMGGMPGGMGGMPGGMGGMPGGMGGMADILSDPEIAAGLKNPKVMAAMAQMMGGGAPDPSKIMQLMSDPEVGPVLSKIMAKFGGGGMPGMGMPGGMGGMPGGMGGFPSGDDDDDDIPYLDDLPDLE